MKYHYILLLLFPINLLAQEISKVDFTTNEQQKTITITYDLVGGHPKATYAINLYCEDKRTNQEYGPLQSLTGTNSYGANVTPGKNKTVVWKLTDDLPQGLMSRIRFRIEATPNPMSIYTTENLSEEGSNYTETVNGVSFTMVYVKGGKFSMGSNENDDEKPIYEVTLRNFYMAETEVTVSQFKAFIDDSSYKTDAEKYGNSWVYENDNWKEKNGVTWRDDIAGKERPQVDYNHPVIHVSWNDAKAYCKWLSEKTGHTYTLPSEAQWEYAAGGGAQNRTTYAGGEDIDEVAWYNKNARKNRWSNPHAEKEGTQPVKTKKPNQLGLYDMSGNVWEWCEDTWHGNYENAPADGSPWVDDKSSRRVLRGGSWYSVTVVCRVADRYGDVPNDRFNYNGFRIIRSVP